MTDCNIVWLHNLLIYLCVTVQQPDRLVRDLQEHLLGPDFVSGVQKHQFLDGIIHGDNGLWLVHNESREMLKRKHWVGKCQITERHEIKAVQEVRGVWYGRYIVILEPVIMSLLKVFLTRVNFCLTDQNSSTATASVASYLAIILLMGRRLEKPNLQGHGTRFNAWSTSLTAAVRGLIALLWQSWMLNEMLQQGVNCCVSRRTAHHNTQRLLCFDLHLTRFNDLRNCELVVLQSWHDGFDFLPKKTKVCSWTLTGDILVDTGSPRVPVI